MISRRSISRISTGPGKSSAETKRFLVAQKHRCSSGMRISGWECGRAAWMIWSRFLSCFVDSMTFILSIQCCFWFLFLVKFISKLFTYLSLDYWILLTWYFSHFWITNPHSSQSSSYMRQLNFISKWKRLKFREIVLLMNSSTRWWQTIWF